MWRKTKRLLRSFPILSCLAVLIPIAWLLYSIGANPSPSDYSRPLMNPLFASVIVIIAIGLLGWQTWIEYRRKTYDSTLILDYQDRFDALSETREKAARVVVQHIDSRIDYKELKAVEDILDLMENLGFYLKADQLTPEAVHHHSYHWIRIYLQPLQDYIQQKRQDEAPRWSHLESLFDEVNELEATERKVPKERLVLSPDKLKEYLREEFEEYFTLSVLDIRYSPTR